MANKIIFAFWVVCISCAAMGFNILKDGEYIGVHAHRGGAALYPENSLWAMINAVELGVKVLEMDVQITEDSVVVVSHDPFLDPSKFTLPGGIPIAGPDESKYAVFSMDYDSLRKYETGCLPDPQFPQRKNIKTCIPTLSSVILCIESMTVASGLEPVCYNIEIKSDPSLDNVYSPGYEKYADLCMDVVKETNVSNRVIIQSFDTRTLNYMNKKYPSVALSYLVEDSVSGFEDIMSRLDFVPDIYSPESSLLDKDVMKKARSMGMDVIPWTVDDKNEARRLKTLGVDAIITNRPDSMMVWLK